ncbi:MAG: NAD(P)/FAD-dependent oxidoreductase [Acidobacteriota bacterium]
MTVQTGVTHEAAASSSSHSAAATRRYDAVVVGAGFGGLATALRLVEEGARVAVCETLKYPGGCASTFEHQGYRFEAGATLFSGFGDGQLFRRWIDRHALDVVVDWLDPVVELRAPSLHLAIDADRDTFQARLSALPDAPRAGLQRFFDLQRAAAEALWPLLDDPGLLPPFGVRALARHVLRLPRYLPLARWLGRPLTAVLAHCGLEDWEPLRIYADALCQITVQCPAHEAEALFALSTMDYYFRGTGHVRGGIGHLAWALVEAIRAGGGEVLFTHRVRGLERSPGGWRVDTRRGVLEARTVAANLLPQDVARLLTPRGEEPRSDRQLDRVGAAVADGWGACMLYRVVRPAPLEQATRGHDPAAARHVEIVQDVSRPFIEGNHLFCSLSARADPERAPLGWRTLTVSTHVPMATLLGLDPEERGDYVEQVQQRMKFGLARHAPEWRDDVRFATTASPRTFARFTGRHEGFVGGVPRRAGFSHYRRSALVPPPVRPGLFLIGDSVFPGQSTLATALGGVKAAERMLRLL